MAQARPPAGTQYRVTSQGTWTRINDPAGQTKTEYEVSLQPDGTMMYRIKGEGDTAWRDRTTFWSEPWVDLNKPAAPVTPTPPDVTPGPINPASTQQYSQKTAANNVVKSASTFLTSSIPRGTAQATPTPVAKYKRTRRNPKDSWKQGI
jgi:hypothetical protein